MSERFIVGLDAGSSKICVMVVRERRGERDMIGYGLAPSEGIKKGVVVDIEAASGAVKRAVSEAASASGVHIKAVYAGTAGAHVKCLRSSGETGMRSDKVTEKDMQRAVEAASVVYVPLERETLHMFPAGYALDGLEGIARPLGMSGFRVGVDICVITASHAAVDNLKRCCETAGLRVIKTVFEPVAAAQALIVADSNRSCTAVVDVGGGKTGIVVYRNGLLQRASVLPVGGDNVTNDIAVGLGVSLREAAKLKKEHGLGRGGGERLAEIIHARAEEILELVKDEILSVCTPSLVVITGGTALLKGIDKVARTVLGRQVRVGAPEGAKFNSPIYSTCVGLALYGSGVESYFYAGALDGVMDRGRDFTGAYSKIKGWDSGRAN